MLEHAVILIGAAASGFLSGMSGGGGGMFLIPLYILLGLSPQQAVATGKMNGLGAAYGGLLTFYKSGHIRSDIVKIMVPIAIVIGVVAPFVFVKLDGTLMQQVIGSLLILLVPTLFIKKRLKPFAGAVRSKLSHFIGHISYSLVLFIQAVFGAGSGTLALFVLTLLFGTTKLEANATRRAITAVLVPISFIALFSAGYVVLSYGIVGMIGSFIGTRYGSSMALQRGERFAVIAMGMLVFVSGFLLIATA